MYIQRTFVEDGRMRLDGSTTDLNAIKAAVDKRQRKATRRLASQFSYQPPHRTGKPS
jgi:hypothetical protein